MFGPSPTPIAAPVAGHIALPAPHSAGPLALEEALATRRTVRDFVPGSLTAAELGQLLWAGQGVTSADGRRTVPSAGALYPIELILATSRGLARYLPAEHSLETVAEEDLRGTLARAAHDQEAIASAAAVIVIAAVMERLAKYRDRAERYAALEAGHVAQAILLEVTALGLGGLPAGSFDDAAIAQLARLRPGEMPLYLVAIGRIR